MKIEIIAEIAQGFEGKFEQAKLLIQAAASSGASAVKFQMVYADELATPDYKYFDLFKSLEMSDKAWKELSDFASKSKIEMQLDIFGTKSLNLAENLDVNTIKLHGTDIVNLNLLNEVSLSSVKRILLGAGGAYLDEIEKALEILSKKQVVVLCGFQGYPTPTNTNHLKRISLLDRHFSSKFSNVSIGFADHALPESNLSIPIVSMAIGAGAKVIEKHLTLGRSMKLEDYESALNPDEFLIFTKTIFESSTAFGNSSLSNDFDMSNLEIDYRGQIRRHVVSTKALRPGDEITVDDVTLKRTSSKNPITDLRDVYKKRLVSEVSANKPIFLNEVE